MAKADNKTTITVNLLTDIVEEGKFIAKLEGLSFTAYVQECLYLGNLHHEIRYDRYSNFSERIREKDDYRT